MKTLGVGVFLFGLLELGFVLGSVGALTRDMFVVVSGGASSGLMILGGVVLMGVLR